MERIDAKFIDNNQDYPCVLIGDAVTDFLKVYRGPIASVTGDEGSNNNENLRNILAYYSSMDDIGRVLVISDISFVSDSNTILLKFLEETKLPVILLSRYDKLDAIISSRLKKIIKYYNKPTTSKYLSPKLGKDQIESKLGANSHPYDVVRYQGMFSPQLYKLSKDVKSKTVRDRLDKIL